MQRTLALILPLAVVALVIGCGGDDDDGGGGTPPARAEDALAKSLLLTINDFPTGWSEKADESSADEGLEKECGASWDPALKGRAATGDFSRNGYDSLSQSVGTYASTDEARAFRARFEERAKCLVKYINDGGLDTKDATLREASLATLSFPAVGDTTAAYRLSIVAKPKDKGEKVQRADVYIDLILVTKNRFGFVLQTYAILSPFDTSMMETMAKKAAERIATAPQ